MLKIVKATEMVFKQRVLDEGKGINDKQKLDLKAQYSRLQSLTITTEAYSAEVFGFLIENRWEKIHRNGDPQKCTIYQAYTD